MRYELVINENNIKPHLDIEQDIQDQGNGQFTFTVRLNNGSIVDYTVVEYVDVKREYLSPVEFNPGEESTPTPDSGERSDKDQVWGGNIQYVSKRWTSFGGNVKRG